MITNLKDTTEIRFETYRFYLKCIAEYIRCTYTNWKEFANVVRLSHIKPINIDYPDIDFAKKFLKIAWNTEFIVCNTQFKDVDTIRINNQWKPIQVYYAIYSAGEVLAYLIDGSKANGHKKCLKKLSEFFYRQNVAPWCFAYKGCCGKSKNAHKPIGFPDAIRIPNSNLLRRNIKPEEMIAKCLKAEHLHRIDENYKKQKGVFKYKFDPGLTTLLHFLYRLRIKSNYKDVEIFLFDAPEEDIKEFSGNLEVICFWTLLLFEIFILKRGGLISLFPAFWDYAQNNKKAKQLLLRFNYYENTQIWETNEK